MCIRDRGKSTEPLRFSDIDLAEREVSYGRSGFAMQFMLDTRLSDRDRHPLKTSELIVMDIDPDVAPEKLVWAQSPTLEWDGSIPNVGLSGDRFYRPMQVLGSMVKYTGSVMSIDPAGRGKDETGYAIVKMLNGNLFVPDAGGLQGGYSEETLELLAKKAKAHKVNRIIVESNFGDGMFNQLMTPILRKIYPCTIDEVRHNTQKEKRIIDTLEPVLNQHRLIVDPKVIKNDYESAQDYPPEHQLKYQLIYQLSRITTTRSCLAQDDRLDALSIAVNYWVEQMAQDSDQQMKTRRDDLVKQELELFRESYFKCVGKPSVNSWI